MDRLQKSQYILEGQVKFFKKKQYAYLLDQIIGRKFQNIRLEKNITVEAVVEDNKAYFGSTQDLYKFERGIKTNGSRLFALAKYYNYDIVHLIDRLN